MTLPLKLRCSILPLNEGDTRYVGIPCSLIQKFTREELPRNSDSIQLFLTYHLKLAYSPLSGEVSHCPFWISRLLTEVTQKGAMTQAQALNLKGTTQRATDPRRIHSEPVNAVHHGSLRRMRLAATLGFREGFCKGGEVNF